MTGGRPSRVSRHTVRHFMGRRGPHGRGPAFPESAEPRLQRGARGAAHQGEQQPDAEVDRDQRRGAGCGGRARRGCGRPCGGRPRAGEGAVVGWYSTMSDR